MIDYVFRVKGDSKWGLNQTTEVTLKHDIRYVMHYGAMGVWDIKGGANSHGSGGENTYHARWFKDPYEKTVSLKLGWYEGETKIIEVFTFFQIDVLEIGKYGFGNFYFGGMPTATNIQWEIIKWLPPTPRDLPKS
jgi:hypothetical protein